MVGRDAFGPICPALKTLPLPADEFSCYQKVRGLLGEVLNEGWAREIGGWMSNS